MCFNSMLLMCYFVYYDCLCYFIYGILFMLFGVFSVWAFDFVVFLFLVGCVCVYSVLIQPD